MADGSDRDARHRARIDAARARRRRTRRSGRRRLGIGVAVVVVLAAGVGVAIAVTRGDDDPAEPAAGSIGRDGSKVVEGVPPVEFARSPGSYAVTYLVETGGGAEISVVTDQLSTRRPWESRLETRRGRPPGGDAFSSRLGWFLRTATVGATQQPSIIEVAPGPPPTDLRLNEVIPLAMGHDLIERREVREIIGRRCQIYRSRNTLAAIILPPADDEFVDTCIDEAGVVLEEVVTVDGDILTRRVATGVTEEPALDDALFRAEGSPLPAADGGGFVRKAKDGSTPPGEFLVLDAPPPGFEYVGRFSVVPSQPENFGDDPTREDYRRAGVVDAWRRGVDIIAVDQGGTLRGAIAFEPTEGAPKVAVGTFGDGELLLSGTGVEVRVARDGGRYLRVYGTVPLEDLVAVASSLRAVAGGTLELDDG